MSSPLEKRKAMQTAFYVMLAALLGVIFYGWWHTSGSSLDIPGNRLVAIGRLFGLLTAFCVLLQAFLMSRVPFMERTFDLHDMIDLHKLNGYGVLTGISGHVSFIVLGYASPGHVGLWRQYLDLNTQYQDVFKATLGAIIFFVAAGLSAQIIRRRLNYELWYATHLFMYVAIYLTFLHQLKNGADFASQRWMVVLWYSLYIGVFALLGYYRVLRMGTSFLKHRFRVARIVREAANIYSVYITGKNIASFRFEPGQYAGWRILDKTTFLEAHPFSFSQVPGNDTLRFTFKATGDFAKKLVTIKPGALVLIDGPRGSFTLDRAENNDVLLVAGGIGVAPFLSSIEGLLRKGRKVTLLYALRNTNELAFREELKTFQTLGLKMHVFVSDENVRLDAHTVASYADKNTAIYICGPDAMSKAFTTDLLAMNFARDRVITERFAY